MPGMESAHPWASREPCLSVGARDACAAWGAKGAMSTQGSHPNLGSRRCPSHLRVPRGPILLRLRRGAADDRPAKGACRAGGAGRAVPLRWWWRARCRRPCPPRGSAGMLEKRLPMTASEPAGRHRRALSRGAVAAAAGRWAWGGHAPLPAAELTPAPRAPLLPAARRAPCPAVPPPSAGPRRLRWARPRLGTAGRSGAAALRPPPPRLVAMETVVLPRGRGCRSPALCAPAAAAGKDRRDPLRHPHSPDRCLAHGPGPAPAQTVLGWTALAPAGPKLAFPPPAQSLPARIFVADPRNQALQKSYTMQKHPPK